MLCVGTWGKNLYPICSLFCVALGRELTNVSFLFLLLIVDVIWCSLSFPLPCRVHRVRKRYGWSSPEKMCHLQKKIRKASQQLLVLLRITLLCATEEAVEARSMQLPLQSLCNTFPSLQSTASSTALLGAWLCPQSSLYGSSAPLPH